LLGIRERGSTAWEKDKKKNNDEISGWAEEFSGRAFEGEGEDQKGTLAKLQKKLGTRGGTSRISITLTRILMQANWGIKVQKEQIEGKTSMR